MELIEHPFFRHKTKLETKSLMESVILKEYEANNFVFKEGAPSESLFLILEGIVAFVRDSTQEDNCIDRVMTEGEFFGEIGLFTGEPRALGAIAKTYLKLAEIPRHELVQFITQGQEAKDNIMLSVALHLTATVDYYKEKLLEQEKMVKIGSVMHTIIHDFKNPFSIINIGTQLLMRDQDDPKVLKLCKSIQEQVHHMIEMVNEISEFSQGRQDLQLSNLSFRDLIERFKELNYPLLENDKYSIEFDIEDVEIEAESTKLLRMLQNLVVNAEQSLSEEGGNIRITVRYNEEKDKIQIMVEDNGEGIPEQIHDKLFEPFVTHSKTKGTGLGLAIVKSIVDSHQGKITFETEKNKRTCFIITLPTRQKGPTPFPLKV